MNNSFVIDHRISQGNLHLSLQGCFDTQAAEKCVHFLDRQYDGKGKIFINTLHLNSLTEAGMNFFKNALPLTKITLKNLYLKGRKGIEMMPNGSKMIIMREKPEREQSSSHAHTHDYHDHKCACGGKCGGASGGKGKCKVCKCALKRQALAAALVE